MCPVVRVCLGAAAAAEEMDAVVKCTICNAVVISSAARDDCRTHRGVAGILEGACGLEPVIL